jgi:hypothetical protein
MTSNVTPNTISGRSAFIELLLSEGITDLFGNPGTTELPTMHAFVDYPDLRYVLGLQEAIVVAMADGYARASGELVACNVHIAPELGNAMGSLFTVFNSGTLDAIDRETSSIALLPSLLWGRHQHSGPRQRRQCHDQSRHRRSRPYRRSALSRLS